MARYVPRNVPRCLSLSDSSGNDLHAAEHLPRFMNSLPFIPHLWTRRERLCLDKDVKYQSDFEGLSFF